MALFGWLKKRPEHPSDFHLASMVASTIEGFIAMGEGVDAFSSDALHIVITNDYRVAISAPEHLDQPVLVSVPLNQINLPTIILARGGPARYVAIDMAAGDIVRQLRLKSAQSISN